MSASLAFDLVGDWTSARLLIRLLLVVKSPWEPLRAGFTHRETGERVALSMAPPSADLARAFAAGSDPTRPTLDEPLIAAITAHRSIVSLATDPTAEPDAASAEPSAPFARQRTLLRATRAVINAGALAVRCRTSGLAHGADAFCALVDRADAATGADLAEVMLATYVRFALGDDRPRTHGLHAFGSPDVAVDGAIGPDRAHARLEAAALAAIGGEVPDGAVPDETPRADPIYNPSGIVVLA